MGLETLADNMDHPFLFQKEVVAITQASNTTLDLWVRDGIIEPYRLTRRDRLYSAAQAIEIDLIHLLVDSFRMRPVGARDLARQALNAHRPLFPQDVADIENGRPWHSPLSRDDRHAQGYTRDADGTLRQTVEGDDPAASVMVVLPTQPIARRVLNNIRKIADDRQLADSRS